MLLHVVLCIMDLCCLVYCCKVLCGTCWERGRLPLVAAARKLDVVSIAERVMRAVREVGQSCTNSFSGACQRAVVAIWALLLILGNLLLTSLLLPATSTASSCLPTASVSIISLRFESDSLCHFQMRTNCHTVKQSTWLLEQQSG